MSTMMLPIADAFEVMFVLMPAKTAGSVLVFAIATELALMLIIFPVILIAFEAML